MKKIITSIISGRATLALAALLIFTTSFSQAQNVGQLWGMTYSGGDGGNGAIFKYGVQDSNYTMMYPLTGYALGYISLIQGSDGNLYGMTAAGGSANDGTIFKCTTSGTIITLADFTGTNGISPGGSLLQGSDGNLYGMTSGGGAAGMGTLFKCTKKGVITTLVNFGGSNGRQPNGNTLIQGSDGNLYGMTTAGGTIDFGTIFKCTTSGTLTTLVNFDNTNSNGIQPNGRLIQATDGNLYGMTSSTIFKCTISGTLTILFTFPSGESYGSLIQGSDGYLYGMTTSGGTSSEGSVFKCSTSGTFTTLVNFTGTNGNTPFGSLIQGTDGNLYGMTYDGGTSDSGTIFKCTTSGTINTIATFTGPNGSYPKGALLQASDGNFYGVSSMGGSLNKGTIFKCTTSGTLTTLFNFTGGTDGTGPYGGFIMANDGNFYGMTTGGGSAGNGTIFRCTPAGSVTIIASFNWNDNGSGPQGNLIQATDGNLYGIATTGGSSGQGTIFKCTLSGNLTTLVNFTGTTTGILSYGSLIQASDGNLYGTTEQGGANSDGSIFKCTLSGTFSTLIDFAGTNGSSPFGSLLEGTDGNLYGMTWEGGTLGLGTIFKCSLSGTLTTLVNMTTGPDGELPYGSLIQATDGNLYGMTGGGGSLGVGILFKCTTSGILTPLVDFTGTNGSQPVGSLIQAADGNLYGMTWGGGTSNQGTLFKCTTSGTLTTLINFNDTNGSEPYGSLLEAQNITSINNLSAHQGDILIYPNPNNGVFKMEIKNQESAINDVVEVYNLLGENVYQARLTSGNNVINLSSQPEGIYLYRVISDSGDLLGEGKVVMQR